MYPLNFRGETGEFVSIPTLIGPQGKSSYQVWLDSGNTGTVTDYLNSLKGDPTSSTASDIPTNEAGVSIQQKLDGHTQQLIDNTSHLAANATAIFEKTGYGVVSGLVVSAQTTPDMTVKVSAGVAYTATGIRYAPSAVASLAVTAANATNPRIDIVYLSSAGVITYLAGTAAATPSAPATPTGGLRLAEISVAAGATSIAAANIAARKKGLLDEDWITPTLINGWESYDAESIPKYYKGADNVVRLRGMVKSGTTGTAFATLPVGYRPPASVRVPIYIGPSATGTALISVGGSITLYAASTLNVSVDNMSFRVGG